MFRFEHPTHLYALGLIPVLIIFFYFAQRTRRRALSRFGQEHLVKQLMPEVSKLKHTLKFILLVLVFTLLIIAWANPQLGTKKEKVKKKASDIMVALDISNSMLSDDIKPNRLERARAFTLDLIRELRGERLGSIVFAGNAYLQMPLTTDYAAAAMFVKSANPDQAPTQGTAISEAIDIAEMAFSKEAKNHKVLIVISDGEDHEIDAVAHAKEAHENGLLIFTIGVGTTEGGFIPMRFGSTEDYKRDENGQPVRTAINETMMKDVAKAGGGDYFNIANTNGIIEALKSRIEKVEKRELEVRSYSEYESYFQWFLFPAIIILVIEFMIPYRKDTWEKKDIFKI